ncbi:MAG: hypothetical protein ABJA34_03835 [Pseudonocardiales bacterium]
MSNSNVNHNGDRRVLTGAWLDRRGGYAAGDKTAAEFKRPPASVTAPSPDGRASTASQPA